MRKFPNCWVMPGGHVDPGESFESAVRREIKEEVGLNIEELEKKSKVMIEPYFVFESVSYYAFGTTPPHNGHLVLFYKVQLDQDYQNIGIDLKDNEVDCFTWLSRDEIQDIFVTPYLKSQ